MSHRFKCPKCKNKFSPDASICSNCGFHLRPAGRESEYDGKINLNDDEEEEFRSMVSLAKEVGVANSNEVAIILICVCFIIGCAVKIIFGTNWISGFFSVVIFWFLLSMVLTKFTEHIKRAITCKMEVFTAKTGYSPKDFYTYIKEYFYFASEENYYEVLLKGGDILLNESDSFRYHEELFSKNPAYREDAPIEGMLSLEQERKLEELVLYAKSQIQKCTNFYRITLVVCLFLGLFTGFWVSLFLLVITWATLVIIEKQYFGSEIARRIEKFSKKTDCNKEFFYNFGLRYFDAVTKNFGLAITQNGDMFLKIVDYKRFKTELSEIRSVLKLGG